MTQEDRSIILRARKLAREAHKSIIISTQSGDMCPHVEHLQEVADLVWAAGGTTTEIAAAWLHDSVEDTSVTIEQIKKEFGDEIANIVDGLTDKDDLKGLPALKRKSLQAERITSKSHSIKKIKIADQTSNVRIVATDPIKDWTFDSKREYVMGAKLIVDQCQNIDPLLNTLFDTEYTKAAKYFGI
ncbi:MAG: bifunctional (p)ppGpp synthetase/guanosine-3',5'-bis(diphosphate) 3'-pyrophosphohydrolase [Candidatus Taylorbacteria bacterium]|nr:bifunctional (p)ppGpp synthetase/guanosine-3',5'-bis(diphosphate) 3'-pyrophosphohydrolase [Candidatus Taylorbacteria bacterium]